jgi:hypothetical protein
VEERTDPSWRRWGPYLSERQWGTVREDYSEGGTAWDYLPHDHARSRAYRWGEDGIAGFGDDQLRWCLGLAMWNGRDPILKERLFGLTNGEGNHGEDVKELYYYIDGVPTHSWMRMLYKYPQAAYPYAQLVEENRRRGRDQMEYEVVDTGVFDADRYFDVLVDYAKAGPDDVLMRVSVTNKGPDASRLHLLPHLWSRNTWTCDQSTGKPELRARADGAVSALHPEMPDMRLHVEENSGLLFCDNETNAGRLFGTHGAPHPKDAINDFVVGGREAAVNPDRSGTKCAVHHVLDVPAGQTRVVRLRLRLAEETTDPFSDFDAVMDVRAGEADEFYAALQTGVPDADARLVQRQALAGMLWSKQFYCFDVMRWLEGDPGQPLPPAGRRDGRNAEWRHLSNADVISMPDKWEYPWFASWDLDFHCLTLALVDPEFAKQQILLLTRERYMHPDARLPAYEWAFGDANPPIHAWAALRVYQMDREMTGVADRAFLARVFNKLSMNFTWWVNRKDDHGRNVFQGGFLGLDNIGIFDRSRPLPTGGMLNQSDGTAWMAMYALNLMRIAIELALADPVYEDSAIKFFEHFLYIAGAAGGGSCGLWDEQDQFFYDVLELPDGRTFPLRAATLVGLMPLYAVEVIDQEVLDRLPTFATELAWFMRHRPDLAQTVARWDQPGQGCTMLLSLLRGHRTKMLLKRMLDPSQFLSDHGVRGVSRQHAEHPFVFELDGHSYELDYEPAESTSGLFGGNSNWRGPVWMPVNFLFVQSLREFHRYYGDEFTVEFPTGSGHYLGLDAIADALSRRLVSLFVRGADGRRPTLGEGIVQTNAGFKDLVLFYEYYDGNTGRGVGASHQTGWSGLVALLIHQLGGRLPSSS